MENHIKSLQSKEEKEDVSVKPERQNQHRQTSTSEISGHLQTELIHGVDLVQVVHDKVKQGRPDSYGAIVLSGFVYLHLINFSFQHLQLEAAM